MWGTETARGADTTASTEAERVAAATYPDGTACVPPHRQRSLQLRTASFMCVCFAATLHAPTIAVTCPMGRALTRPSSAAGHFVHPSSDGRMIGGPSFIGWSVRLGSLSGPQSVGLTLEQATSPRRPRRLPARASARAHTRTSSQSREPCDRLPPRAVECRCEPRIVMGFEVYSVVRSCAARELTSDMTA